MDDQLTLIDAPPVVLGAALALIEAPATPSIHPALGEWFQVGRFTPRAHAVRVAQGRHPMIRDLSLWPGARCGNCKRAVHHDGGAKSYWKCAEDLTRWGSSATSDIRLKWRGCSAWQPGPRAVARPGQRRGQWMLLVEEGERLAVAGPLLAAPVLMLPAAAMKTAGLKLTTAEFYGEAQHPVLETLRRAVDAAPSEAHARVAADRWVDVVAAGMDPGPAAELLLAAVRKAVEVGG